MGDCKGVQALRQILPDCEIAALVAGNLLPVDRDLLPRVGRALKGDSRFPRLIDQLGRFADRKLLENIGLVDLVVHVLHQHSGRAAGIVRKGFQRTERASAAHTDVPQVDHLLSELLHHLPAIRLDTQPLVGVHRVEGHTRALRDPFPPACNRPELRFRIGG